MSERFKVPDVREVLEYGLSIGYRINAEQFLNYYEARGWMMVKTPIKSWKACVRTWKMRAQENGQTMFTPVPKESDEARRERLIKGRQCVQCVSGRLEWDEDRASWICRACNSNHNSLVARYG